MEWDVEFVKIIRQIRPVAALINGKMKMSYYSVISLPGEFINFQNAFASFDMFSSSCSLEHIRNVVDGLQAPFVRDNKVWQRKTVLRVADRMGFYIAFDSDDVSYEVQMNIFSSFANCFNSLLKRIRFIRDPSSFDDKLIDNSRWFHSSLLLLWIWRFEFQSIASQLILLQ